MNLQAIIFDWGGTLTRWHDVDFHAESLALAELLEQLASVNNLGPSKENWGEIPSRGLSKTRPYIG